MDWKDPAAVVHTGDRIDARAIEEVPPECCTSGIGGDSRRQDQPKPAASPQQLQRSLDEQLVTVGVGTAIDHGSRLELIDAI